MERSLDDGDGLQIRTAQGDAELIYAGHDTEAGQIAVVRLRPDIRTKAGDEVYRLTSEKQLQWARSLAIPAIPADMALIAYPGKPLALTMTDGESSVTVTGDTVAPAQSRAMSEEDARALIVSGFADNVSKELPVEYAVEMNNLIRLEMKGSIG